jgi:hypothetical protein
VLLAIERRPVLAGIAFAFAASVNFTALVAAAVLCVWALRRWSRPEVAKFVAIVGAFGALPYLLMSGWIQNAQLCGKSFFQFRIGKLVTSHDPYKDAWMVSQPESLIAEVLHYEIHIFLCLNAAKI